jgi:hypothetical protein
MHTATIALSEWKINQAFRIARKSPLTEVRA